MSKYQLIQEKFENLEQYPRPKYRIVTDKPSIEMRKWLFEKNNKNEKKDQNY